MFLFHMKCALMADMMRLLVTSGVSSHSHPAVALQFFECVTRYEKFFSQEPQYIPNILTAFLDNRGMRNSSPRVRTRTAYLFSRVVRCLKTHLTAFTEEILTQLTELLVLAPPVFENGVIVPLLTNDDQLYIFESASILIVSGSWEASHKEALLRNILSPILIKVTSLLEQLTEEQIPARQVG